VIWTKAAVLPTVRSSWTSSARFWDILEGGENITGPLIGVTPDFFLTLFNWRRP
jgi:hypothetical protein